MRHLKFSRTSKQQAPSAWTLAGCGLDQLSPDIYKAAQQDLEKDDWVAVKETSLNDHNMDTYITIYVCMYIYVE